MSPKEMRDIKNSKDTKEKIIEVAARLFAKQGFSGTSVREIAKEANVNLSAINYHFDNKDNLYIQVFAHNHSWLAENIERLGAENQPVEEFTSTIFNFMIENGPPMMNTFKIFLSDEVTIPQEVMCTEEDQMGPPGHQVFLKKITEYVGEDVPLTAREWAVSMIFSNIVHFGICSCSPTMKEKAKKQLQFKPENLSVSLQIHTKAILEYIRNNPTEFTDPK